jgi:hypothetical protein
MARPATADHLKKKRPATKTVEVVLDPALAVELRAAEHARTEAERLLAVQPADTDLQAAAWAAAEEVDELRARAVDEDAVVAVRFRSIGRVAWDDLIDRHPPTDEQIAEAKRAGLGALNFNSDTYPPALVAASLDEPKLSAADVLAMWDSPDWNAAELQVLFSAALEVNQARHTIDVGKGSAGTAATGKKSTGAASTASPTASS